jgi:hypothetical protein
MHAQVDDLGRLWILTSVVSADWRSAFEPDPNREGDYIVDLEELYDTRVEVIDTTLGRLLKSGVVDPYLRKFVGNQTAFSYREDGRGYPFLDIWSLVLVDPRK